MVHPVSMDVVDPAIIACSTFHVHYTGKEAHACAFPECGINAADAFTVAQTAVGLLRHHNHSTKRIHALLLTAGTHPTSSPHTEAKYIVRAQTLDDLGEIKEKVGAVLRPAD